MPMVEVGFKRITARLGQLKLVSFEYNTKFKSTYQQQQKKKKKELQVLHPHIFLKIQRFLFCIDIFLIVVARYLTFRKKN